MRELRRIDQGHAILVEEPRIALDRLLEPARGLARLEGVVRSEGVVGVTYGAGDFAVSVGGTIAAYARNPYVKTRIAVAAAAKESYALLIIGLAISIPLVVYGATLMIRLIERFPFIVTLGAALIGYIGGEVIVTDPAGES